MDNSDLTFDTHYRFMNALLKFHLGISKGKKYGPWIGFNDQENESIFVWSDGSTGEIHT